MDGTTRNKKNDQKSENQKELLVIIYSNESKKKQPQTEKNALAPNKYFGEAIEKVGETIEDLVKKFNIKKTNYSSNW